MRGYRISVIRHGATEASEKGIYIGRTDYPLSEKGIAELNSMLSEYQYPFVERVYSGPLKRCVQTAQMLFPDAEIRKTDGLNELDFGDFEGKTVDELVGREDFSAWLKGGLNNAAPNGETVGELIERTYLALADIFLEMVNDEIHHCAIVTHSGVLANMLSCFGIPKNPPSEYSCRCGEGFDIMLTTQLWHQAQAFEIMGLMPYKKDETAELDE